MPEQRIILPQQLQAPVELAREFVDPSIVPADRGVKALLLPSDTNLKLGYAGPDNVFLNPPNPDDAITIGEFPRRFTGQYNAGIYALSREVGTVGEVREYCTTYEDLFVLHEVGYQRAGILYAVFAPEPEVVWK